MGEAEKKISSNDENKEVSPAQKLIRRIIGTAAIAFLLFVIFRAVQVKYFGG